MSQHTFKAETDFWVLALVLAFVMFQNAKGTEYDLVDALILYLLKQAGVQ